VASRAAARVAAARMVVLVVVTVEDVTVAAWAVVKAETMKAAAAATMVACTTEAEGWGAARTVPEATTAETVATAAAEAEAAREGVQCRNHNLSNHNDRLPRVIGMCQTCLVQPIDRKCVQNTWACRFVGWVVMGWATKVAAATTAATMEAASTAAVMVVAHTADVATSAAEETVVVAMVAVEAVTDVGAWAAGPLGASRVVGPVAEEVTEAAVAAAGSIPQVERAEAGRGVVDSDSKILGSHCTSSRRDSLSCIGQRPGSVRSRCASDLGSSHSPCSSCRHIRKRVAVGMGALEGGTGLLRKRKSQRSSI